MYYEGNNSFTKRIEWIDIAKGIGILAVLIGHAFSSIQPITHSFNVPLFFVMAGYTIKNIEKGDLLKATIKDFRRLIVPCILTRIIIMFGDCIIYKHAFLDELLQMMLALAWGNHNGTLFGIVMPTIGRIWFLPALFWTKLFYRLLMFSCNEGKRLFFLLPLSLFCMYFGMNGYVLPQNYDMIFICMLFVEIGYLLRQVDLLSIHWCVVFALFIIWTYFSCSKDVWIQMNGRYYPGYGLCLIVAISGCVCIILFSQSFEHFRLAKPFCFYGRYSLELLVVESVVPFFFVGKTSVQKLLCIAIELMIVIIYALGKKYIRMLRFSKE